MAALNPKAALLSAILRSLFLYHLNNRRTTKSTVSVLDTTTNEIHSAVLICAGFLEIVLVVLPLCVDDNNTKVPVHNAYRVET